MDLGFAYVIVVTAINAYSMESTSSLNFILVVFTICLIGIFIILASVQLNHGMGNGTLFTIHPLSHENVKLIAVLSGATVVAFSFIGFDAITMYTEEAKDTSTVPRAILLTVLIGGVFSLLLLILLKHYSQIFLCSKM